MKGVRLKIVVLLFFLFVGERSLADNPRFTLWLRGPCDEVIEGPAGGRFDDGTGGAPDFENGRPGINFEVVLTQGSIVHQFWSTSGWSWGLGIEGPLEVTDITLEGTVSCTRFEGGPPCLGRAGFYSRTELTGVPYGKGPQTVENHGALSLIALGTQFGSLPGVGDYVIARIRVTGDFPDTEGASVSGRVFFTSRAGSNPQLLTPSVTYSGLLVTESLGCPPLTLRDCPLTLRAVAPVDAFIRCDTTNDGRLDITDPVRLLNHLFVGVGPPIRCPAAADCNGDGEREISDAVYALSYLFLGTGPPPAPFPECGKPPGLTQEDCPGGSTICP